MREIQESLESRKGSRLAKPATQNPPPPRPQERQSRNPFAHGPFMVVIRDHYYSFVIFGIPSSFHVREPRNSGASPAEGRPGSRRARGELPTPSGLQAAAPGRGGLECGLCSRSRSVSVYMYICVCMFVCMDACTYVCTYVCIHVFHT